MSYVIATELDCKDLDSSITINNANHCPNKSEILGFGGNIIISGDYADNQLVALKDLASLGEVVWKFTGVNITSSTSHGIDTNITFSGFDWYGFGNSSLSMSFSYNITVGGKAISSAYYSVDVTNITCGYTKTQGYISASANIQSCYTSCTAFTTDATYESTSGSTYPIFGTSYPGVVWAKILLDLKYEDQILATKYICAAFGPSNIMTSAHYYRPVIGISTVSPTSTASYDITVCGLYTSTTPSTSNVAYVDLNTPTSYNDAHNGFTITYDAKLPRYVFPLNWETTNARWLYRELSNLNSEKTIAANTLASSSCKLLVIQYNTTTQSINRVKSTDVPIEAGIYYFFRVVSGYIYTVTISA